VVVVVVLVVVVLMILVVVVVVVVIVVEVTVVIVIVVVVITFMLGINNYLPKQTTFLRYIQCSSCSVFTVCATGNVISTVHTV
jgi:hypothetical protein